MCCFVKCNLRKTSPRMRKWTNFCTYCSDFWGSWVFVVGQYESLKREKSKEQSRKGKVKNQNWYSFQILPWPTGFSLIPPLCSSLTDKPLQLCKGVAKCVIRLSWRTDVSLTLIWAAVCVTNGPEACQREQMRGRGRDAGHFDIRMMETLLWFSSEGPTARFLLLRNELSSIPSTHGRRKVYGTG